MRLYTFMNYYLSSLQQGLQTAHIQGELNNKLHSGDFKGEKGHHVLSWQNNHKTIIICNGGNSASIRELCNFFTSPKNPYPWSDFREDSDSLDGALTGVGIILPEEIYEAKRKFSSIDSGGQIEIGYVYTDLVSGNNIYYDIDTYEYQLIDRIKSAPLAR